MRTDVVQINTLAGALREIALRIPEPHPLIAAINNLHDILGDIATDLAHDDQRLTTIDRFLSPYRRDVPPAQGVPFSAQLAEVRLRVTDLDLTLSRQINDLQASLSGRIVEIEQGQPLDVDGKFAALTRRIDDLQGTLSSRIAILGQDVMSIATNRGAQ